MMILKWWPIRWRHYSISHFHCWHYSRYDHLLGIIDISIIIIVIAHSDDCSVLTHDDDEYSNLLFLILLMIIVIVVDGDDDNDPPALPPFINYSPPAIILPVMTM